MIIETELVMVRKCEGKKRDSQRGMLSPTVSYGFKTHKSDISSMDLGLQDPFSWLLSLSLP